MGRIKLSDTQDLVASLADNKKLDLRLFVKTDSYTAATTSSITPLICLSVCLNSCQSEPLIVTNWSQNSAIPTKCLSGTESLKESFKRQISALVNLFGGLWRGLFFDATYFSAKMKSSPS